MNERDERSILGFDDGAHPQRRATDRTASSAHRPGAEQSRAIVSAAETWSDDRQDDRLPMVRKARGRRGPALGLNLTSMIDVVFLLLIYFIVATDFKTTEERFRLDLPDRSGVARDSDPFQLDEEPLHIRIASVREARGGVQIRLDGPYPQPASFDDLYSFLRQRQIAPDMAGGLFPPDHPIIIEPIKNARWEHAIEAFNAAHRARYTNVSFARGE